jgi:hypothetical protein
MREGSTGKPFRSKYWGLLYFSAPTLLKYAGELGSFDPMNGAVVFLKLHFTNDLWHWWKWFDPSGDEVRLFITIESGSENKTVFMPFRSHELGRSAWNRGGLNVAVKVTSKIFVWNWSKLGFALVAYANYLAFATMITTWILFSFSHQPGFRHIVRHCLCRHLFMGRSSSEAHNRLDIYESLVMTTVKPAHTGDGVVKINVHGPRLLERALHKQKKRTLEPGVVGQMNQSADVENQHSNDVADPAACPKCERP